MSEHPWSIVTIRNDSVDEEAAARLSDGVIVRLPSAIRARGVMAMMEAWDELSPTLRRWTPDPADAVEDARVLAPLRYPRKLICVAANYADHLREMGHELPAVPPAPFFFLLPPSTTLIADGEPIRMSADPSWRVDWEAELAVVIGRAGRQIRETEALEHVAGFSILNDVTARGLSKREDPLAPPFTYDWMGAKGIDTFCPMGPGITPAWLVDDPQALGIRCWINDVLKQDGNTADMLVGLAPLIAAISETMTLEPGDVVATGTPAGVGNARGDQLHHGDRVTIEIEGIGRLSNPVLAKGR